MPVSTRSQITNQGQNEQNSEQRTRTRANQEDTHVLSLPLRNPHHGLKEKMKALTLLYEQQKQASAALKSQSSRPPEEHRFTTHPSVELLGCSCKEVDMESKRNHVMRENAMPKLPNSTITRTYVLPQPPIDDAKENVVAGSDRIVGFSCPRKATVSTTVARKLSMGASVAPPEVKGIGGSKNVQELERLETVSEKPGMGGSRILVFVRLRPMAKKEKEAGSRCCVKIVNRRDVYLTEFANENDYLRLKRLRGRHFTFDASFPDNATQQEVYLTT
jgi:kinesin family protein 18/19